MDDSLTSEAKMDDSFDVGVYGSSGSDEECAAGSGEAVAPLAVEIGSALGTRPPPLINGDSVAPGESPPPPRDVDPSKVYVLYDYKPGGSESSESSESKAIQGDSNELKGVQNDSKEAQSDLHKLQEAQDTIRQRNMPSGASQSVLEVCQDDACELLNDSDPCWWFVRHCSSGREGFVPCELLETYPERLARFNSFKNEQALLHQVRKGPSGYQSLRNYKSSKSVSFSDVVSYSDTQLGEAMEKPREEPREKPETSEELHPYIEELYGPVFTQVDSLLVDLDRISGR